MKLFRFPSAAAAERKFKFKMKYWICACQKERERGNERREQRTMLESIFCCLLISVVLLNF
jgi:hypothetical protein